MDHAFASDQHILKHGERHITVLLDTLHIVPTGFSFNYLIFFLKPVFWYFIYFLHNQSYGSWRNIFQDMQNKNSCLA